MHGTGQRTNRFERHSSSESTSATLGYAIVVVLFVIISGGAYVQKSLSAGDLHVQEIAPSAPGSRTGGSSEHVMRASPVSSHATPQPQPMPTPPPQPAAPATPPSQVTSGGSPPAQPATSGSSSAPLSAHVSAFDGQITQRLPHAQGAWRAVLRAHLNPHDLEVVPVLIIPLFHDAAELKSVLTNLDAPVRTIQLVWNSVSTEIKATLEPLRDFPFGVTIHHFPENGGFSHAINTGIINGNATLSNPPATWFFAVNADSVFPAGNMGKFARMINEEKLYDSHGLLYGPRLDHFAFAITRLSVETVGLMDEVFYPGYMEDIDYWWRNGLAELPMRITNITFIHKVSTNMKKPKTVTGNFKDMLVRTANGFEYGWAKWGMYLPVQIGLRKPPLAAKGWKTPFNIPGAPLSLWKVDPVHRECIRQGPHAGKMMVRSSTCWYNGTGLLSMLPPGTDIPPYLRQPAQSLRYNRYRIG